METLKTFQDLQKLSMKKQFEANDKAKQKVQELDVWWNLLCNSSILKLSFIFEKNESILNTNYAENRVTFESNQVQAQSLDLIKIEERDNALKKLEHTLSDLNVIMKDLAVLVHDQGDFVNSIEANIETTQSKIQSANQNLEKAVKYKVNIMSRNNKKKEKQTTYY
jgi:hypothetical protein